MVRGLIFGCAVLLVTLPLVAAETLVKLDGSQQRVDITGISADGTVNTKKRGEQFELMALRKIVRSTKSRTYQAPHQIIMQDGGMIRAKKVTLVDGQVVMDWTYGNGVKLPLDRVAAVWLDVGKAKQARDVFVDKVAQLPRESDTLFAKKEKELIQLEGAAGDYNGKRLTFVWSGEEREVKEDKVYGIVFAAPSRGRDQTGEVEVWLADGSVVWGSLKKVADGKVTLGLGSGEALVLPWGAVMQMRVRSDRLSFISDRRPERVEMMTLFTFTGWERDKSVLRKPLTLDGTVYEKGIGAIAVCRLTYNIDGRYDEFAATIGIDDATEGRGDCEFVVKGDGRELYRQRVKGSDKAKAISLKVTGVRQLTLALEMGEDATVGDHGNWADARLIKQQD